MTDKNVSFSIQKAVPENAGDMAYIICDNTTKDSIFGNVKEIRYRLLF